MLSLKKLIAPAALIATAVGIVGCGNSGGVGPNTTSRERFLNALVGGPSAGVNFVQRGILQNPSGALTFGALSPSSPSLTSLTGYNTVAAGGNSITGNGVTTDVYTAPSASGTGLAPEQSFFLAPHTTGQSDGTYTIALAGINGSSTAPPTIYRIIDSAPPVSGAGSIAYLRVVNLAPDTAGTTGLTLDSNGQAVTGLSNIAYGTPASSSNYISLPVVAGTPFDFSITYGAGNQAVTTSSPLNSITLQPGHAYTLFLTGEVNPVGGAPVLTPLFTMDE